MDAHTDRTQSSAPQVRPLSTPEDTGCCPRFNPVPWSDREITWTDELFVKEHVRSFLHVPLNMGKRVVHAQKRIFEEGAQPQQPLMLSDERSPWKADLYIRVTKPVSGMEVVKLPGTYLTRVYDGPYQNLPMWAADMQTFVQLRGKQLDHLYFAYTTCPKCAKAYGKNYVVAFAKLR